MQSKKKKANRHPSGGASASKDKNPALTRGSAATRSHASGVANSTGGSRQGNAGHQARDGGDNAHR